MNNGLLALLTIGLMAGCTSDRVIVDERGLDKEAYQRDLEECTAYREQVNSGEDVATGAAVGAVVGAAVGAIVGDSRTAARSAGVGAVAGGTDRGIDASREKSMVVKNCLRGRGYRVLN